MDDRSTTTEGGGLEVRRLESLEELIPLIEVRDVQFEELSAGRAPDADGPTNPEDEIAIKFDITEAREGLMLLVRVTANVGLKSSLIRVTAIVSYEMSENCDLAPSLFAEFIEKVAFFTVYPYIRSSIQSLAMMIDERKIILPIIRAGEISLKRE